MRVDVNNRAGARIGAWKNQKPEWTRPGFFIDPMSHESPRSADLWKTRGGTFKAIRHCIVSHKTRRFDDDNPCCQGFQHEPFGV